jgi:hypothetical protein
VTPIVMSANAAPAQPQQTTMVNAISLMQRDMSFPLEWILRPAAV